MTTDLVSISIAFLLVVGRLYTKCFITKSPGWEDCMILACHVCEFLGLIVDETGCSVLALIIAIGRVVGDFLGTYLSAFPYPMGLFRR